jgi:23S rRNA pseudouridine955/2504/2580 synthase
MAKMIIISADSAGQRIDNFLVKTMKGVPKSRLYRGLRKGEFRVNGGRVSADYRLCAEDKVRIPPIRVSEVQSPGVPPARLLAMLESRIIYEDRGLLVLNKPSGFAVHGGTGVSWGLIEMLRHLRPQKWPLELVHRLDRETSGCLLIAKKRAVLLEWHASLAQRKVKKMYTLLVKGVWQGERRQVEWPLNKNVLRSGERMVVVDNEGKSAITHFMPLQRFKAATLLSARLITGRTHQIRVHASTEGHPIAGDGKYGDPSFNQQMKQQGLKRLFLHCHQLDEFSSPIDRDLQAVIDELERS